MGKETIQTANAEGWEMVMEKELWNLVATLEKWTTWKTDDQQKVVWFNAILDKYKFLAAQAEKAAKEQKE